MQRLIAGAISAEVGRQIRKHKVNRQAAQHRLHPRLRRRSESVALHEARAGRHLGQGRYIASHHHPAPRRQVFRPPAWGRAELNGHMSAPGEPKARIELLQLEERPRRRAANVGVAPLPSQPRGTGT